MIVEIADWLEDQAVGVVGTDIFTSTIPSQATDNVILVADYAGEEPIRTFGSDEPLEQPGLTIKVRDADYATGLARIRAIVLLLEAIRSTVIGTTTYYAIQARQSPAKLEQDGNDRYIFVVNFAVIKDW